MERNHEAERVDASILRNDRLEAVGVLGSRSSASRAALEFWCVVGEAFRGLVVVGEEGAGFPDHPINTKKW